MTSSSDSLQGCRCVYCARIMYGEQTGAAPTRDHAVPKSRGGTMATSNRLIACFECNQLKNDRTLEEWLVALKFAGSFRLPLVTEALAYLTAVKEQEAIKQARRSKAARMEQNNPSFRDWYQQRLDALTAERAARLEAQKEAA